jgi:hypothetical protein
MVFRMKIGCSRLGIDEKEFEKSILSGEDELGQQRNLLVGLECFDESKCFEEV